MEDDLTSVIANAVRFNQYLTLESSVLYLYDPLPMLDLEVNLLWPSRWTVVKVFHIQSQLLGCIASHMT
ncbi:hypothetical protein BDN72DRAFT_899778 [Pluteus cervinus]|uniref:Uncharacterized protein n=1 Tax=Pluteus cervinus TaxID=181527 RepID=A0ACD3ALY9_9AGAR|nr:hypothetical protein BDN72DRAFT_899778 [Pluteus cervinus]